MNVLSNRKTVHLLKVPLRNKRVLRVIEIFQLDAKDFNIKAFFKLTKNSTVNAWTDVYNGPSITKDSFYYIHFDNPFSWSSKSKENSL